MNEAPHRRIGFALRYIPTRIRQTAGHEDSATLVRGVDRFNNFVAEPWPPGRTIRTASPFMPR
jgi:hypothetical protein